MTIKFFLHHSTKEGAKATDYTFISDFDNFLSEYIGHLSRRPLMNSTINKIHSFIKAILLEAEKEDLISKSPYFKFKFRKIDTASSEVFLTKDDLKKIAELDLSSSPISLREVRDIFLFMCYTGLRFSDAMNLKYANFQIMEGKLFLKTIMIKTKESVTLPIPPEGLRILKNYDNTDRRAEGYALPKFTNQKLNQYLKTIADLAGVQFEISSRYARHTCATMLLSSGLSPQFVQHYMGHKNINTTMRYAKLLKNDYTKAISKHIDEAFD